MVGQELDFSPGDLIVYRMDDGVWLPPALVVAAAVHRRVHLLWKGVYYRDFYVAGGRWERVVGCGRPGQ